MEIVQSRSVSPCLWALSNHSSLNGSRVFGVFRCSCCPRNTHHVIHWTSFQGCHDDAVLDGVLIKEDAFDVSPEIGIWRKAFLPQCLGPPVLRTWRRCFWNFLFLPLFPAAWSSVWGRSRLRDRNFHHNKCNRWWLRRTLRWRLGHLSCRCLYIRRRCLRGCT